MFILLSNLLTYESHIKSYVLQNMSYVSYVLYVLSYVLYVYHMYPRKLQFFGKFLNFRTVPLELFHMFLSYVISFFRNFFLYMLLICLPYVASLVV